MIGRVLRDVQESLLLQQPQRVRAAGSHRPAPRDRLQRARRLQQMVALQCRILRHVVLPHVIGDLVPAARRGTQRLRIQFADAARREDGRLDVVRVEQLDQPPDADAPAELALGKLHRRFVQQPSQQHGIEIGGEVHRDPRARRARSDRRCAGGVRRSVAPRRTGRRPPVRAGWSLSWRPLCNNPDHTTMLTSRAPEPHSPRARRDSAAKTGEAS